MSVAREPGKYSLAKTAANYVPLTPLSFLARTAVDLIRTRVAVIHGALPHELGSKPMPRCRRLAAALAARGVGAGDTVAMMAPNVPGIFERHSRSRWLAACSTR